MTASPMQARNPNRQAWTEAFPAAVPPVVVDALAAAAVCALSVVALAVSDEPGARPADAGAYGLLVAASAPLLWRRHRPVGVLAAVVAATLTSFVLDYPGGPVTIPLMAAIYVTAVAGSRAWTWLATAVFAGGGAVFRALVDGDPLVSVALNSALFVLAALLGDAVSSRRALREEVQARLRHAEVEREQEAQRRVLDERVRIARELHDVMAHTITTVNVQAGVAADRLDDRPEDTRTALHAIRDSARQALSELRATVSVLRDGTAPSPLLPTPGLADLPALVASLEQHDLRVRLETSADLPALPAATELTAYRIVQEALTNVVRHADATTATVTIEPDGTVLRVAVDDDGRGIADTAPAGYGLQGMRERAEAIGGRLCAGPNAGGGFRVAADLPAGDPRP